VADKALSPAPADKADAVKASDCPPGAYCEAVEVAPPSAKDAGPLAVAANPAEGTTITIPPARDPHRPRVVVIHPGRDGRPDEVIVYENGEVPPHLRRHPLPPAPPAPPPPVKHWRHHEYKPDRLDRHRGWGVGLRAEGAVMAQQHQGVDTFGIGGIGMSLRYRPIPAFAVDVGSDVLVGRDTNGWSRREIPVSASMMLYLNPRNIAQFYLLGGGHVAFAHVRSEQIEPNLAKGTSDAYTYAGGQVGAGFEFRVSPLLGLHIDGLAFFRGRIDSDGNGQFPEYYNRETGQISNSSAGGLLRAGVNFWW
jgi:hypothetical protein